MLLAQLVLSFVMVFLAGCHWQVWYTEEHKPSLFWSIFLGLFGLYFMISMIGRASTL